MQAPPAPAAELCAAAGGGAGQQQALQQQQAQDAGVLRDDMALQQHAQHAAPVPAAAAATGADPQQQPAAAGPAAAAGGGSPDPDQGAAADGDLAAEGEEGEEYDEELGAWLAGRLHRMQPGAELTVGSVKVLGKLLVRAAGWWAACMLVACFVQILPCSYENVQQRTCTRDQTILSIHACWSVHVCCVAMPHQVATLA